ncbi:hypothetical protein ABBQ38_010437 [Trebouxia sp. C0009 RCD-2024]
MPEEHVIMALAGAAKHQVLSHKLDRSMLARMASVSSHQGRKRQAAVWQGSYAVMRRTAQATASVARAAQHLAVNRRSSVNPKMVPLLTQKGKQAIHACHAAGLHQRGEMSIPLWQEAFKDARRT